LFGAVHHIFERMPLSQISDSQLPNVEAKYRALVEQLPAVVFMAYLDGGVGEAYVSPQIEASLGFSQAEWLEDPVLWYRQIHPEDEDRWSAETAEMFICGKPLRSPYRVLARDGHVIWFRCEVKMMRHEDGSPWFIHGIAFDITDLKNTEEELQDERNVVSAILDTVGALVVVADQEGRIVRFNRACEQMTGQSFAQARGQRVWDIFALEEEKERFERVFRQMWQNELRTEYESSWVAPDGSHRTIAWSASVLPAAKRMPTCIIASGIDAPDRSGRRRGLVDCWKPRPMPWWWSTGREGSCWSMRRWRNCSATTARSCWARKSKCWFRRGCVEIIPRTGETFSPRPGFDPWEPAWSCTSTMRMSGLAAAMACTAVMASSASLHTTRSASRLISRVSPCRTIGWSSTTNTFFFVVPAL